LITLLGRRDDGWFDPPIHSTHTTIGIVIVVDIYTPISVDSNIRAICTCIRLVDIDVSRGDRLEYKFR
jgi:hypothetical protein